MAFSEHPGEGKLLICIDFIASTIIDEGTDRLTEYLDGPPGSDSKDARKAGYITQDLFNRADDEAYIESLANNPALRGVFLKLLRESLLHMANDCDTWEAEGGEEDDE